MDGARRSTIKEEMLQERYGPLLHRIRRDCRSVPLRAQLRRPFQRFEVHVVNPEALAVAVLPFKVVHQTPQEVAPDRVALHHCPVQLREVRPQVHHAVHILHPALGGKHVV